MIATVEGVMMPPEGGYREIRKFAYTQKESDTSHGGDLLKDANHAWEIVQRIVGGSIYAELPPRGPQYQPCWVVQVQVSNSHRLHSEYRVDYRKFDGCPLCAIDDMFEIYALFKRAVRGGMPPKKSKRS